MIERNGVVETYNAELIGTEGTVYGVTEIKQANTTDTYETDGYDTYYVYGLALALNADRLNNYIAFSGDGSMEIIPVGEGDYGTGAIIKVYDEGNNHTLVEQFRIVIFGDLDGDADVSPTDTAILKKELKAPDWTNAGSKINYLIKAADIDPDGDISPTDSALEKKAIKVNGGTINQKTGVGS